MGVWTASHQGTSSFELPRYSRTQLEKVVLCYSTSIDGLANVYKGLGYAYHDLPLHIRTHSRFPKDLQDISMTAFTCSDSREMPDMIQILNQIRECFARARAGIVCDEPALAAKQLYIAAWLVREAEYRVADLTWVMTCYKDFIESAKGAIGVQAYCTQFRQASVGSSVLTAWALMKWRWQDALPKNLQGK